MKANSLRFFIFASAVLIAYNFDWYGDITAILVMIAIGFFNLIYMIENKFK